MLDVTVPIRNTCWTRLPRLWVYMRVGPNREVRGTPGNGAADNATAAARYFAVLTLLPQLSGT